MTFPIFLPESTPYSRNDQFLLNFSLLQHSFRICLFVDSKIWYKMQAPKPQQGHA